MDWVLIILLMAIGSFVVFMLFDYIMSKLP